LNMLTTISRYPMAKIPLGGIAVVLGLWFGGMALIGFAFDPPAVVVFAPVSSIVQAVTTTDAKIMAVGPGFMALRAGKAGYVRRLYASGAWFVWPILPRGCEPLFSS
jgi:hypothetical protein